LPKKRSDFSIAPTGRSYSMNDCELKLGNDSIKKDKTDWDIHKIANELFRDLNGSVTLSVIQETLEQVIPRYESARIQTYVPIFIRRETIKRLKTMQASFTASEMEINQSEARIDLRTSSAFSLRR
jgi:hypothetical protein